MPNLYEVLQHRKCGGGEGVIEREMGEGQEEGREGEIKEMREEGEKKRLNSRLVYYLPSPLLPPHPTPPLLPRTAITMKLLVDTMGWPPILLRLQ